LRNKRRRKRRRQKEKEIRKRKKKNKIKLRKIVKFGSKKLRLLFSRRVMMTGRQLKVRRKRISILMMTSGQGVNIIR